MTFRSSLSLLVGRNLSIGCAFFNNGWLISSRFEMLPCRILLVLLHRQRERGMYCWGAFSQWLVDESMQVLGGCDLGCPAYFHNTCKGSHHQSPPISDKY